MAEIRLIDSHRQTMDNAHGLVYLGKDASYLVRYLRSIDQKEASYSVVIQSFQSRGYPEIRKAVLPDIPLVNFSTYQSSSSKEALLVYADLSGDVRASQFDDSFATIKRAINLEELQIPNEVVLTPKNYVIGGIDTNRHAALIFLDKKLSKQIKVDLPIKKKGGVTSLFFDKGRLFAISSHFDATAYMHELSLTGGVLSTTQLRGGGATGVVLANRGFAVSYFVNRQVFIERFDGNMKSLWTTKLHDVLSAASKTGNIHDMKNGISWVGANNGKLTVYRLDDDGNILRTSIDESSGYDSPPSRTYLSVVQNRDIHIRYQAKKMNQADGDFIYSIHSIDVENNR